MEDSLFEQQDIVNGLDGYLYITLKDNLDYTPKNREITRDKMLKYIESARRMRREGKIHG